MHSGLAVLLVVGCAWACASAPRTPKECDAKKEIVDAYLDRVLRRTINQLSATALARTEQVTVLFEIDPKGAPAAISVLKASTPVAAAAARDAVMAGAPYGTPPFSQKACLIGGRISISLFASGRCDDRLADAYVEAVQDEIQAAMSRRGVRVATNEDVVLRVDLGYDGSVQSITVRSDDAEHSGAAIAALAHEISPFDAPHELIRDCVADSPVFLWFTETEMPL